MAAVEERSIPSLSYGVPPQCLIGNLTDGLGPARAISLTDLGLAVAATGTVAAGGAGVGGTTATIANNRVLGNTSGATAAPTAQSLVAPAAGITITGGSSAFTFALGNDLAALEALSSTGIAVRTGSDAWAQRTLTAPAAGITITNPAGIAGNPTFALADDLGALEALTGTGYTQRTGASTWATYTFAAGTGISISTVGTTVTFTASATAPSGMLPLVNGDLPGPGIMSDPDGQCIGVPL